MGTTTKAVRPPGADYKIRVRGIKRAPLRDFYHALLRASWAATFGLLGSVYLAVNALFAGGYLLTGGIANARPGSFADAFFFSVQTMGTIGYGGLMPSTNAANALVVFESMTSIILTALATGMVFSKFSRPTARLVFTREIVIAPVNGVPTLSFRLGNERSNEIVDAQIRLAMVRTEITSEGRTFYRMVDLTPTRERALSLTRSLTVMHTIDEKSPLYGVTPKALVESEAEFQILVVGLDDTTMQPVHAGHRWYADNVRWDARHVDILREEDATTLVLDLTKFHDLETLARS